jgi:biotin operon repressor
MEASRTIDTYSDLELKSEKAKIDHQNRIDQKKAIARIKKISEIPRETISWLWPNKFALRKFNLLAGDPGLGKSLITVDLAARISQGRNFPDNENCPAGDTLFLTAEDDPADTIRPRLEASFAELDRIHILQGKSYQNKKGIERKGEIVISEIHVLKDAIDQVRAKGGNPLLLVIDPIDAFLGMTDSYRNSEVRGLLTPLCELAMQESICVIGIMHLNKGGGSAAYRVGGSIGFTAAARSVWITAKNSDGERLFLPLKNNLGKDTEGLKYCISEDTEEIPFIEWTGFTDENVNDVLQNGYKKKKETTPEREEIIALLKESGEPLSGKEIATELGKNRSTVRNLLSKMHKSGEIKQAVYGKYTIDSVDSVDNVDSLGSEAKKTNELEIF